jgi:hypothetical protein
MTTPNHIRLRPILRWLLIALASGAALLACLLMGELLPWPGLLDSARVVLTRTAHLLVLPLRPLLMSIQESRHHTWPLSHWILSALLAPLPLWVIWHFSLRSAWMKRPRHADMGNLSRREFLTRAAHTGAVLGAAAVSANAALVTPQRLRVREYSVAIDDLPPWLDGLRVAHVGDTHLGPFVSLNYLERVVDTVNGLEPDIVALTGDYVHRTPRSIRPGIQILARLRPRVGPVAVLGNHDHWVDATACRAEFSEIDLPLIDNGRLFLTRGGLSDSPQEDSLCFAGVGDLWEDDVNFDAALAGLPPAMPRLLLSHNPDVAEEIPGDCRVDLMLSGHTHGGQVRLPFIGAPLAPTAYGPKYLGGLCRGPMCRVVISRGVGMSLLPLRFGVPPEVGMITLRAAS